MSTGREHFQAYVTTTSLHGKDQYVLTFDKYITYALLFFVNVEALINNVSDVNRPTAIYWTFMFSDSGRDNTTYCVIPNVIDIQNCKDMSYMQNRWAN